MAEREPTHTTHTACNLSADKQAVACSVMGVTCKDALRSALGPSTQLNSPTLPLTGAQAQASSRLHVRHGAPCTAIAANNHHPSMQLQHIKM